MWEMKVQKTLFLLAAIVVLTATAYDCERDKEKIDMRGYYSIESDPGHGNVTKYMQALGVPEKWQKIFRESKKVLIQIYTFRGARGKEWWSFTYMNENDTLSTQFVSGRQFRSKLGYTLQMQNTVTIDDKTKSGHWVTKTGDGVESTQTGHFCHDGFIAELKAKDAVATILFSRRKKTYSTMQLNRKSYFANITYTYCHEAGFHGSWPEDCGDAQEQMG